MKEGKHNYYRALYQAAKKGDWETAKSFIDRDQNALTARITSDGLTMLMVAARACKWKFVQELIKILPPESLAMQTTTGLSTLHYVAVGGNLDTAKALIRKNPNLTQIQNQDGHFPVTTSVYSNCKQLVWYLVLVTKNEAPSLPFTGATSAEFISSLILMGYYGNNTYFFNFFSAYNC